MKFAKKMAQIAHFWPPEWPIQSTPPHRRSPLPTRQSMQRPNVMNNNKDCRIGQFTSLLEESMSVLLAPLKKSGHHRQYGFYSLPLSQATTIPPR